MRPSGLHDARDLARLVDDGLVRVVAGDVHAPVDVPDVRQLRAAAVRALLPDRLVVAGAAVSGPDAAWLHGGGPAPARLHVALPIRRGRPGTPLVVVHEARIGQGDVELVDGVPVTVPARTAADVARLLPADRAVFVLRRLASAVPLDPRDALVHLERLSGCRGVEEARRIVLLWSSGGTAGAPPVDARPVDAQPVGAPPSPRPAPAPP